MRCAASTAGPRLMSIAVVHTGVRPHGRAVILLPLAQTGWHSWVQTNDLTIIGRALYQLSYAPKNF